MSEGRGYLLPDGEAYTADMACQLVWYPDKPEYSQALLGSLGFLATWTAWERDSAKRGKDAARAWKDANALTMECWKMACLEQLQDDVSAIRLLLQQQACCDNESITYAPTTIITTTIIPEYGTDPTHYGETAVADWEEWLEHICYQGNAYVDLLIHYGETIDALFNAGGLTLDAWSKIVGWLTFAGLTLPVYLGDVMEWLSDFFLDVTDSWFDDVTDDLNAARDNIVCALIEGRSLSGAVEAAITSELAWTLFYSLINYDSVTAVIYEGGYGDDYLETETALTCTCFACLHIRSTHASVTINEQNSHGCNMTLTSRTLPPPDPTQHYAVTLIFNQEIGVGDCAGTKTIITASTSDGLKMSRLITYDDNDDVIDDFDSPTDTCTEDISLINNTSGVRKLYIERTGPSIGGCGVAAFDVDLTYEDD